MPPKETFGILPSALKERIQKSPGGAFAFYGPEELLKQFYLEKFTGLIEKEGMAEFNLVRLDFSAGADLGDLEREINTLPVMAPHRMILCRSVPLASFSAEQAENLASLLRSFPDEAILVIYLEDGEFSADKKTLAKKSVQILRDVLTFCAFPLQGERVLLPWAAKILARDGLVATEAALRTLVRLCDGKMAPMRGELDKIACYCLAKGKKNVEEAEVILFARDTREFAVWGLMDAVLDGAAGAVESLFFNLMRQKTDPLIISAALSRLLVNCLYVMEGADEKDVGRLTGLFPWQYERYRRALYGKKKENVEEAFGLCTALDRALKNSPLDGAALCEKALLSVARLLGGAA